MDTANLREGRTAVVIGASIAGLLAARALSPHVDRVLLIDRDDLPDQPVPRSGVPHGRHTHGLLARGREVIEELLPGATADLVARGALLGDAQVDGRWYFTPRPLATGRSGLDMLGVSRPMLEWYVRQRVLADPRVRVLRDSVLGLALHPATGRAIGVMVVDTEAEDPDQPRLQRADLVVDASGRTSRLPEWLQRHGLPAPREQVRRADRHYATRHFARRTDDEGPLGLVVGESPELPRGGVMVAQEDGSWTVSLTGGREDQPPTDLPGFLAYAASLQSSVIADALVGLEPLDEGRTYRFPVNRRRHYEELADLPGGLVVVGDAFCAFNPVYGQGMTVAALEAHTLAECLAEGGVEDPGLGRRFHRRAARHLETPWAIAVEAMPEPGAQARRQPLAARLTNAYLQRVLLAGADDPEVAATFLKVNHLAVGTEALLRPGMLARVARHRLTARLPGVTAPARPELVGGS